MAAIFRKKFLVLTAIAALLFAVFAALGIWQVYRLQWKLDLIAAVDARVAAPVAPAPGHGAAVTRENDAYRHVSVTGSYIEMAQTLIYYPTQLGAGYFVMTPLLRNDGSYVLINRGFVPEGKEGDPADYRPPAGEVTVEGLLRMPESKGWLFSRASDPVNGKWYRRDVASIMATRGLVPFAPYFIDAAASGPPGQLPIGGLTVVKFRNSHLSYALTWFAMALGTLALYVFVLRYERRPPSADEE
ncbi:SURF1 family protein [Martelella soudanensis]|uniref:SURF1 family protein n=1 Tax=unclassified Martelella TaxID=2629616 RepID=UPI0015DF8A5B|nr:MULTISPECIES: SURF1 family protein [unclassified Martelella]